MEQQQQGQQRSAALLPPDAVELQSLLQLGELQPKSARDFEAAAIRRPNLVRPRFCGAALASGALLALAAVGQRAGGLDLGGKSASAAEFLAATAVKNGVPSPRPEDRLMKSAGGLCLDVPKLEENVLVRMWLCATETTPQDAWHYDEDQCQIRSSKDMCLDAAGDFLHIGQCDTNSYLQKWDLDHESIVNQKTGLCLTKGTNAVQNRSCESGNKQQSWTFSKDGAKDDGFAKIRQTGSGCLHVAEPGLLGTVVGLMDCAETARQAWKYMEETKQISIGDKLCLESLAPDAPFSGVRISACNPSIGGQVWRYYSSGQVATEMGGLCLDTPMPEHDAGDVHVSKCDKESKGQRWHIATAKGAEGAAPAHPEPVMNGQGAEGAAPPDEVKAIEDNAKKAKPFWPTPFGAGDMQEFYVYRAAADGEWGKYPFGNINVANMDGVMWYLMNEVVTNYGTGVRCPRKFNISVIHRIKIKTRATPELITDKMNFGVRFAYDMGMCMGRCFPENMCTCKKDCDDHYAKYGYFAGCNRFKDKYPFPVSAAQAPEGIWYSLPLEGRCDKPTGAHNCTWSSEEAGMITLEELEATTLGKGNCCGGHCTDFWKDLYEANKTTWRSNEAMDVFKSKFSDMPRDLDPSWCDFDRETWYAHDAYKKQDPWQSEDAKTCRER